MPGFDGTGPSGGQGMAGRRQTMCRRTEGQTFSAMKNGRGRGQALGRGRLAGQGLGSQPTSVTEGQSDLETLKAQYQAAREMMNEIEKKIQDLESKE